MEDITMGIICTIIGAATIAAQLVKWFDRMEGGR